MPGRGCTSTTPPPYSECARGALSSDHAIVPDKLSSDSGALPGRSAPSSASAIRLPRDPADLPDLFDLSDLPDLADLPDFPDLADLPDLTDLGEAAEMSSSLVSLSDPSSPDSPASSSSCALRTACQSSSSPTPNPKKPCRPHRFSKKAYEQRCQPEVPARSCSTVGL